MPFENLFKHSLIGIIAIKGVARRVWTPPGGPDPPGYTPDYDVLR